jgi:hypothetical protein
MLRSEIDGLDPRRQYWVPSVVAPQKDWSGAPGCRKGARFLIDRRTLRPARDDFETFDSEFACLGWLLRHRARLDRNLGGVRATAVPLDRWLLGLD